MSPRPEIQFDPERHEYRVGGARWPSVTQVLDPLLELDGIPRHLLEAAARFGTHVHQACHLLNQGVLDESSLDDALRPYVDAWKKFLADAKATVVASELRVAHLQLRYAGTLDAIVMWRGRRCLIDIKTSTQIPRTVGPQTAAYAQALGKKLYRYCVQLKADATYRTVPLRDPADWSIFLSALNIHHWRNKDAA